ncbi:MFS transporter [Parapedobacter koreensis]|uniref:Nucleoside transporter n=1 Tax=Parapedobacter koreensis TaxID=332977 RepID=A0A1H7S0C0_9SPHI|nr:MFS transporter [Parapedobacter koreensis]SEL65953.1 nucleoside transporter [Parapedobacter koreensis]
MNTTIRIKLSLMMFLQFFIKGSWFVTVGTFLIKNLQASGTQVGLTFMAQSIGAILPPFLIGLLADRYIAAQRLLCILHIIGGILLWCAGSTDVFGNFYIIILLYMMVYMPTMALINTISFRQMNNPDKEFPPIRVFGTLGWVVAGLIIGYTAWEQSGQLPNTFKMAALASGGMAVMTFFLPATPPLKRGGQVSLGDTLGLDALRLLKDRSYLVFFLASIALCIPLAFYYSFTNPFFNEIGVKSAAGIQAMGQVSELLFMLLMPFFFVRLGVKYMLGLGMLGWAIRYALFRLGYLSGSEWPLIAGILIHGICFDFFFVTGQIYTNNKAGDQFKNAAQGLITLATYGVGMMLGSVLAGFIVDANVTEDGFHHWETIWMVPSLIAGLVLVLFLFLFKTQKTTNLPTKS